MMSSSDLPACPACGVRTVRSVHKREDGDGDILATFYACSQCGADRTDAWKAVQPPPPPEKAFADLPAAFDLEAKERHEEEDLEKGGDS